MSDIATDVLPEPKEFLYQESTSPEYIHFNSILSNWIVFSIFFSLLSFGSYLLLDHFSRSEKNVKLGGDGDGGVLTSNHYHEEAVITSSNGKHSFWKYSKRKESLIPFFLCVLSLSSSLASTLLIPITIVSNEILVLYPNNGYIVWLHKELIVDLWNLTFLSSNACLFILLPFAYFYHEAEGFRGTKKGIAARLCEAAIVLLLVFLILGGIVFMLYCIVADEHDSGYISFSFSLISTVGSLIFLVSTPIGFTTLTKIGFSLRMPIVSKETVITRAFTLDLEIQTLKSKLESQPEENSAQKLNELMISLLKEQQFLKQYSGISTTIFWNVISICLTIINLLLPALILFRVSFFLIKGLFTPLSTLFQNFFTVPHILPLPELFVVSQSVCNTSINSLGTRELNGFLVFEEEVHSKFVSMSHLVDIWVIVFVMVSAFVGFYQLPWISTMKPLPRSTSIHRTVINVALILLLSSSFPVVARILGLTFFDLMGYYHYSHYVENNSLFHDICKIIFVATMTQQYVKIFQPIFYAYRVGITYSSHVLHSVANHFQQSWNFFSRKKKEERFSYLGRRVKLE